MAGRRLAMLVDVESGQKPERFSDKLIGGRVREARRRRVKPALSTPQLAKLTGIGQDSLYKKQRGDQIWYMAEISRICDVLRAPYGFPFIEWGEALLLEDLLSRARPPHK